MCRAGILPHAFELLVFVVHARVSMYCINRTGRDNTGSRVS